MRSISLTEDQFQYLLEILDMAKNDAKGWSQHVSESREEDEAVEEYCKEVDTVIALLKQSTTQGG